MMNIFGLILMQRFLTSHLTREMFDLGYQVIVFNPFETMSLSYSMWSVMLIPYNMPLWWTMTASSFMMALLILGPDSQEET